jgi:heptosyltransferase-1
MLFNNILVVRLGSMGDIIHTLPAVATLKNSFRRARITWAIDPKWAVLLRGNPSVDRILPLDLTQWRRRWRRRHTWKEFLSSMRELRLARFDLAMDFQGLTKSALVAAAAHPEQIIGFHQALLRERLAGLFYSRRVRARSVHKVEQNLELAASAGALRRCVEFPIPECPPEGDLPEGGFVLASPFAGWTAKQWPPAFYAKLAGRVKAQFGWPLVMNCPPAEQQQARGIVEQAPRGSCLLNVTSVEGLIGATRRACAVVGVDSGPLHLAVALGKPGVALFGPTDPARNGPYAPDFAVLRAPGAVTSYRRTGGIAPSMLALQPDQVLRALESQIFNHRAAAASQRS